MKLENLTTEQKKKIVESMIASGELQTAETYGRTGGLKTLAKYGKKHYQNMIKKRWNK